MRFSGRVGQGFRKLADPSDNVPEFVQKSVIDGDALIRAKREIR